MLRNSSITTFIKIYVGSPFRYVIDTVRNYFYCKNITRTKTPTFAFHISKWKRPLFRLWFPDRHFRFFPLGMANYEKIRLFKFIQSVPNAEVMIWGCNTPTFFDQLSNNVFFIEDGFIRSLKLGAGHTPPLSITIDSQTPYFDATKASDLENLLNSYDFQAHPELIERAKVVIQNLLKTGISKYNHALPVIIKDVYGRKTRRRILVIGQVEDDASIRFGCMPMRTNNDLIRTAANENPDAQILFKPHPDVLNFHRSQVSDPKEVSHLCQILDRDIPLAQAFETIDHVYTLTSQAGFEALLRDIPVTILGSPFYSGWGLTDDRQLTHRRNRKLSKEELFAGAYILYPLYYDYRNNKQISIETAVLILEQSRHMRAQT
ncbi:MAG TPA: cell surface protein [Advenella kashmirensis]|uniref:Cell surface protein n=1 Tax=Advenella kashmirensis TaxID=310575 RepID=A0A356LD26_9BURK|nr:cell surface protein [Advenella kashmirensis]